MATNKLNFSAAGSNLGYKSGIGALSDRLMEFGSELNDQEQKKLLAKEREQDRQDKLNRYAIEDQRYLEQKAEKASDKFDARQKEIATNEALALVGDEKGFLSTKTSAENKAYQDALATVEDPAEKARLANEIKQYQTSGEQAKSWKDSILGNSSVDQKVIGDLKRELARDEESARRFNLQLAETRATRNEAKAEREAAREREEKAKKDLYGSKTLSEDWQSKLNIGQSGAIKTVENVSTGQKILDPKKQDEATKFEAEQYETDEAKANIAKINELSGKILTPEQLKDDNLKAMFEKENPEAYNKGGTLIGKLFSGANKNINMQLEIDKAREKLRVKPDPFTSTNAERKEYEDRVNEVNNEIKLIKEKYDSSSSDKGITFDEFKKAKIKENEEASKEYNKELSAWQNKVAKVNKDVLDKYGIEEKVNKNVYMTPSEAGDLVYKQTLEDALKRGISADVALYTASTARVNAVKDLESRAKTAQSTIAEDKKETKTSLFKIQEEKVKSISDSRKKLEENLEALKRNVKYMEEVGAKQFNKEVKEIEDKIIEEINKENDEIAKLKASLK